MRTRTTIRLLVLMLGLFLATPGVLAAPFLSDFAAATFLKGGRVDNPYFPIIDDLTLIYKGQRLEGNTTVKERNEITNVGLGPKILGVRTAKQLDRVFENGVLVEKTLDYYAQDTVGNVWYFGEDVTNYLYDSMGNLAGTNHNGSWRAGVNSALPGFIMPASKTIGFNYYQEFAPNDAALDQGTTFATGQKLSIKNGRYKNVLKILETTAVNPDARSFKYYAPGIGLIYTEEDVSADLMSFEFALQLARVIEKDDDEDYRKMGGPNKGAIVSSSSAQSLRLVAAAVPEPTAWLLVAIGVLPWFCCRRCR